MPTQPGININAEQFVKAVVGAALGDGRAPKELLHPAKRHAEHPFIVVAAAPRSGSTFLANALSQITNLRYFRLCSAYSTNEHDLYLPALCIMQKAGCVSQMHMKGTFHNSDLLRAFGIRPIILVRGIYDTVASLLRDLRKKEKLPGYSTGQVGYSFLWLDVSTRNFSDERLLDLIIDLAVPWYVNFYASWHTLCKQHLVDALWLTYEEMMSDKKATIERILSFVGFPAVDNIDSRILNRQYATFNEGTIGRGDELLSPEMKHRIARLFSYYPDVDFAGYGLAPPGRE
jgi:hypothetical protein